MTIEERNKLVEEFIPLVRRLVMYEMAHIIPEFIDKDDIQQEVLVKLPHVIERFESRNGATLRTFLGHAIHCDIVDAIRKEFRRDRYKLPDIPSGDPPDYTPRKGVFKDARGKWVNPASGYIPPVYYGELLDGDAEKRLTPKQVRALRLVYVEGYTQDEAAGMMGIGRVSLAKLIDRGKDRLMKLAAENRNGPAGRLPTGRVIPLQPGPPKPDPGPLRPPVATKPPGSNDQVVGKEIIFQESRATLMATKGLLCNDQVAEGAKSRKH